MRRAGMAVLLIAACGNQPVGVASSPDAEPAEEILNCAAITSGLDLPAQMAANAGADRTRYPLVLAHGFLGFDEVGPLQYFVGVADALRADGFAVYVTAVAPIAGTDAVRGPQLGDQVECIARATGAERLNLIGHSQGGIDVRFVASDPRRAARVDSVTTIATPHRGTPVADATLELLPDFAPDLRAAMESFAVDRMEAWNAAHPDTAGIAYYSWTGVSGDGRDPLDPMLAASGAYLQDIDGANDGLVSEASAAWGQYLGNVPADHFDEVGLFSINETNPFSGFNHLEFFRDLAANLRSQNH